MAKLTENVANRQDEQDVSFLQARKTIAESNHLRLLCETESENRKFHSSSR